MQGETDSVLRKLSAPRLFEVLEKLVLWTPSFPRVHPEPWLRREEACPAALAALAHAPMDSV